MPAAVAAASRTVSVPLTLPAVGVNVAVVPKAVPSLDTSKPAGADAVIAPASAAPVTATCVVADAVP